VRPRSLIIKSLESLRFYDFKIKTCKKIEMYAEVIF